MSYLKIVFFVVIAYGMMVFFLVQHNQKKNHQLFVVCTTTIIADMVRTIGTPYVTVKTLMGPGVDPHLYRARESDVTALSSADCIFYNGLHLEGKMGEVFSHMNRYIPTIAVAETIPSALRIASGFAGIYDPHVWHDVTLWRYTIGAVEQALSLQDPEHAQYYHQQAKVYDATLQELNKWMQEQLQTIPKELRMLVTAHDAFSYFGRAYGIEVIGLQGISTDALVTTADIAKAVDYIVYHRLPALFLESSIAPRGIQAVQQAVAARGWQVHIAPELFSDSLGDQSTTADSYCGMMRYNTNVIVSALTQ
jgi:manganese/zinc/iron transport system substrate-binding protein